VPRFVIRHFHMTVGRRPKRFVRNVSPLPAQVPRRAHRAREAPAAGAGAEGKENGTMRRALLTAAAVGVAALAAPALAADVSVGNVSVEVKEKSIGADKGIKYLRVGFRTTVNDKVRQGQNVYVHADCQSDVRRKEGEISAIGSKLHLLAAGESKEVQVPLFINDGFHVRPHTCGLEFRFGERGRRSGTKVADYCWERGTLKEGTCS
jgi:hypothetical protein